MTLLCVENLNVTFNTKDKSFHAVRGIDFSLNAGESVGIVGESGCGKSAAALAIKRLSAGDVSGNISFRGKSIGIVFQDPMTFLNPTMKIGHQIIEGPLYHKLIAKSQAKNRALELLRLVGISNPEIRINQYPHQLSGGMRQRVLIAIAIACNPDLLIADEPTTALDVTLQAQILDLIKEMQKHLSMGLILISHDFGVIARVCETVLVMYAGKIVERGDVREILERPKHPYTRMLLNSLPTLEHPKSKPLQSIEGTLPDLSKNLQGCSFKPRCPFAAIKCEKEPTGRVACWRAHD
jgi:oligopeptide/dipeptide ABC transporter ATP-binding protein